MEMYIGTKVIHARSMNRGDYNLYRGWQIPVNENPADEGYLVMYEDNYISWSPKSTFEAAYRKSGNLDFGAAKELMIKQGKRVARKGWNGAGMFAYYVKPASYPAEMPAIKGYFPNDMVPYRGYFALKTAQEDVAVWVPSGSDIQAEDWEVVE